MYIITLRFTLKKYLGFPRARMIVDNGRHWISMVSAELVTILVFRKYSNFLFISSQLRFLQVEKKIQKVILVEIICFL